MENFAKMSIFAIFMIAEIHKIDLKATFFQIFKNPNGKGLDIWVKIHCALKKFFQGIADFTWASF